MNITAGYKHVKTISQDLPYINKLWIVSHLLAISSHISTLATANWWMINNYHWPIVSVINSRQLNQLVTTDPSPKHWLLKVAAPLCDTPNSGRLKLHAESTPWCHKWGSWSSCPQFFWRKTTMGRTISLGHGNIINKLISTAALWHDIKQLKQAYAHQSWYQPLKQLHYDIEQIVPSQTLFSATTP